MSQRECAGFNWPPLSIPAEQPVSISPETVKRAGVASRACIAADRNPPFAALRSVASNVQSVLSPSAAKGVLHPARCVATAVSVSALPRPHRIPLLSPSSSLGVGQPDRTAAWFSVLLGVGAKSWAGTRVASFAVVVGHPPQALSDVRRADARRAKIGGCDRISQCFQVSPNSVEPIASKRACNLFPKDDWRAALADESCELWPEVALVVGAELLTGGAEGLAGAGSGPDGLVVGPASETEGVGPDPDASEEMGLIEPCDVLWSHVPNRPLINLPRCDVPGRNQIAKPLGGVWFYLVVIRGHGETAPGLRQGPILLRPCDDDDGQPREPPAPRPPPPPAPRRRGRRG